MRFFLIFSAIFTVKLANPIPENSIDSSLIAFNSNLADDTSKNLVISGFSSNEVIIQDSDHSSLTSSNLVILQNSIVDTAFMCSSDTSIDNKIDDAIQKRQIVCPVSIPSNYSGTQQSSRNHRSIKKLIKVTSRTENPCENYENQQ